jgi:tetratricopeptide (TPR) repeat protein
MTDARTKSAVTVGWVAFVLGASIAACYLHALPAPFVMDDHVSIPGNPSIRSLARIGDVLFYPHEEGRPVDGRPLLNFSLAVNRTLLGTSPAAFRSVNLMLHWIASLLLFDVVRRILSMPSMPPLLRDKGMPVALACSILWAVHPLQTAAVTYVIQRSEILAAVCLLAGLDTAIVGCAGGAVWLLPVLAMVAALGGTAKETIVCLPFVTVLVDRAVIASSWAEVRRHWKWHLAAAAGWPIVVVMLTVWGGRGSSAGFGSASPWLYLLRQAEVIWTYLARVVWPAVLVFDYGERLGAALVKSSPWLLATGVVVAGVCVSYLRWPRAALGPLLFLVLLAPTSSIVPVKTQTAGEHRLYVASATLIVPLVIGLAALVERLRLPRWTWPVAVVFLLLVLGCRTYLRNEDYLTPERLWRQSLTYDASNERAALNLAGALLDRGDERGASELLGRVNATGRYRLPRLSNAALLAIKQGRFDDALVACDAFLSDRPDDPEIIAVRGFARWRQGDTKAATADIDAALAIDDRIAGAWNTRGNLLLDAGRPANAIVCFEKSIDIDPAQGAAWSYLGVALQQVGRVAEARQAFDRAITNNPRDAEAHYNRANLSVESGQRELALSDYGRAIDINPVFRDAIYNRCVVLARLGRTAEARLDLERFLHLGGQPAAVLLEAVGAERASESANDIVPNDAP